MAEMVIITGASQAIGKATALYLLLVDIIQGKTTRQDYGQKNCTLVGLGGIYRLYLAISSSSLLAGDWEDFVRQWHTSHFVHLMSWDFCLMWAVFPALLGDDMARRRLRDSRIFWAVALVPLFGALAYLCLRPPLPEATA